MIDEVRIRPAHSEEDLCQILDLQRVNVEHALTREEIESDGFLTCEHDLELLKRMNEPFRHTVAMVNQKLVGYCLVLLPKWDSELCVLRSMIEQLDNRSFRDSPLDPHDYVIAGQVCIARSFRGKGLFRSMYQDYCQRLSPHFRYCITEVDAGNVRSLKAHLAIGFQRLHRYQPGDGHDWELLIWDWRR